MDYNKNYIENLNYLKDNFIQFYEVLVGTDISNIALDIKENSFNIQKNGKLVYPECSIKYNEKKVLNFINNPSSFNIIPQKTEVNFEVGPVSSKYYERLDIIMPEQENDVECYHNHLDSLPVLIMFGVGTGEQISQLIDKIDIKTLIIVDEDLSLLKASTYISDWKKIISYFSQEDYSIEFIINKDPISARSGLLDYLKTKQMYYAYFIPFFKSYENDFFDDVIVNLKKNYIQILQGWGFYDDELMSLDHTLSNISKSNKIPILKKELESNNIKAFLISSGPSLDDDLEYIKEFQNKVVVFSCGTALGVLIKNGIIPDFHVETERTYSKYEGLSQMGINSETLSKISFIGLNCIHPEVFNLFEEKYIFNRSNDCGASLLDDIPKLEGCNPTATNGTLSLLSYLGFNEIYLFGTDLGYKDEKKHHSKDSAYFNKNLKKHYNMKMYETSKKIESNFGESEIFTNDILYWCKSRLEQCVYIYNNQLNKDISYYNCSDGGKITGIIPFRSIDISHNDINKDETLCKIKNCFSYDLKTYDQYYKNINFSTQYLFKVIKDINQELLKYSRVDSFDQLFALFNSIYKVIYTSRTKKEGVMSISLLKGTSVTIFQMIYIHSLLSKNFDDSIDFINESLEIYSEFLIDVLNHFKQ